MADWMKVNGVIFGSHPWKIYGEGPARTAAACSMKAAPPIPQDIRFTRRGSLYAYFFGWPDSGNLLIRS